MILFFYKDEIKAERSVTIKKDFSWKYDEVKKDKKQLRSETKEEHWCNTAIEIKNKIEGRRRNGKEREEREEQAGRRERRQRGEETKAAL